jgi:hypothetical protein
MPSNIEGCVVLVAVVEEIRPWGEPVVRSSAGKDFTVLTYQIQLLESPPLKNN